jgi:hypothetical protein
LASRRSISRISRSIARNAIAPASAAASIRRSGAASGPRQRTMTPPHRERLGAGASSSIAASSSRRGKSMLPSAVICTCPALARTELMRAMPATSVIGASTRASTSGPRANSEASSDAVLVSSGGGLPVVASTA